MQQALATVQMAVKLDSEGNKIEALRNYEDAVNSLQKSILLNEAKSAAIHTELERQLNIYSNKVTELKQIVREIETKPENVQDQYLDHELLRRVESTIVNIKPNENFESVAGLHQEKEFLNQAIVLPIEYPELFDDDVQPFKAFLLFGVSLFL